MRRDIVPHISVGIIQLGTMTIEERQLKAHEGEGAVDPIGDAATWRQRLRSYVVSRGIQLMCGSADGIATTAANDIPLVRSTARLAWLKALGGVGVKSFIATSGLGYRFVCHTGDLANFPFYHPRAYQAELLLCARWLQEEDSPVMYDIGANDGFFSTHLAQMLDRKSTIYAFEPVPMTFTKLVQSVERLNLKDLIHPVPAAVVDHPAPVRISYSERNSLHAQVIHRVPNPRAGDKLAQVEGLTLDDFYASVGAFPRLLKIDAEGSEVAVLRGAQGLLSRPDRPAILFEYNPTTLTECGVSTRALLNLLPGYALHYVDDLRGQMFPFGRKVRETEMINWICNLFAVPMTKISARRWASALQYSARTIRGGISR
jgi:FkbM family methyltransferase